MKITFFANDGVKVDVDYPVLPRVGESVVLLRSQTGLEPSELVAPEDDYDYWVVKEVVYHVDLYAKDDSVASVALEFAKVG